jgi:predicted GNAT family N-acyltransferase
MMNRAPQTLLHADAPPVVHVRFARTAAEFAAIVEVRRRVFLEEQGIVEGELTDAEDQRSFHVFAEAAGSVVGVGRLSPPPKNRPDAQIAWVATLPAYRRRGIAGAMMRAMLDVADAARYPVVLLSAQTHALDFYRRLGFRPYGDRFLVRGIEHQFMERRR